MRSKFLFLLLTICLMAITTVAHSVPPEEVVDYINSKEVKESACVEAAEMQKDLPRLLVVEVGQCWYKLDQKDRHDFAKKWNILWRHSVPNGIVSVLDKKTGSSVVNFHPDGQVDILK